MPLQSFGTSIGSGVRAALSTTDSAFIVAGGLVSSSDYIAIYGFGSNHTVHVQGTVVGWSDGILLGAGGMTSDEHVLIEPGGFVGGYQGTAIYIFASNSLVENRGRVYSTGAFGADGVAFAGAGAGTSRLINSGLIEADWPTATGVINFGTGTLVVTNSGTIRGGTFAFLDLGGTIDQITNTGQMIGTVQLGSGNDSYNGASGHLSGHLVAGAGADTAIGGIDNDWFEGGADNDVLRGNGGSDRLDGGAGNDTMFGGIGNDIYLVDSPTDIVNEAGGNGIDTVFSSISFSLANAARAIGAVENLTLLNVATALNGFGNVLNNTITGNNFNNTLNGMAGNDILIGGLGRDAMTGGAHNDIFRFAAATHSVVANPDVITDFDDSGNDRIDVSALFGPAMTYRHNLGFTAAGQVRIADIAGPDVIVQVNTGGSLAADFAIRLAATTLGSMTASDFFL